MALPPSVRGRERDSSLTLLLNILHHHRRRRRLGRRCRLRSAASSIASFGFGGGDGDDFVGSGIRILFAYMRRHTWEKGRNERARASGQRTRRSNGTPPSAILGVVALRSFIDGLTARPPLA